MVPNHGLVSEWWIGSKSRVGFQMVDYVSKWWIGLKIVN